MTDLELQKKRFVNHVAKFTDYGNIKIVDFKMPDSGEYRIRFLFEEDYCRLHISGDLGELIATNCNNMTFKGFSDFVNNIDYFKEKIDCHNRRIYTYDSRDAKKDLKELLEEDGFYLATLDGEICGQEEAFTGLAEFEHGKWIDDEEGYKCVLAWQPLPEPYIKNPK